MSQGEADSRDLPRPAGPRRGSTRATLAPTVTRLLSVVVFTGILAVCYTAIKAGLAFAPPLRFAGLRAVMAGVALLLLLAILRGPLFPGRASWPAVLALALASTTVAFGAMFLSPSLTSTGIASVLGNTQPLFAIALAAVFLGERVSPDKGVALALGLGGMTLISYPALVGSEADPILGAALALGASAGAAAGSVIVKRLGVRGHVLAVAAWRLIIGGVPLLAASALLEREATITWAPQFLGLLLFLALVGTSLTTVLWYWLVEREDVGRLTLFLFLAPLVGLGIAVAAFGEQIGLLEGVGVGLATAAIGVVVREAWQAAQRTQLSSSVTTRAVETGHGRAARL